MAYVQEGICSRCKKSKMIISSARQFNTICNDCLAEKAERKRERHFAILDNMTLEERVRRIEQWIYNYKPTHTHPLDRVF